MMEIKESVLKNIYKKRELWSRKYDFGHLLVIGGSKWYSGSPAFNALAALRSGVDLVTVVAPERAANIIASFSPDLIAYPLRGDILERKHVGELLKYTENKDACVIGGGLGRDNRTLDAVTEFLKKVEIPTVVDADAIHAIAKKPEVIADKKFILTPHSHEFLVLTRMKVTSVLDERINAVKSAVSNLKTTILLKGHVDIISDGRNVALNRTGSPYMTKGGMGDTLAGICGALLARKVDIFTAACGAAFINGKAGELASNRLKESVTASDLINEIPKTIRDI
jgi:NAD(P)H-hydrate epimerase